MSYDVSSVRIVEDGMFGALPDVNEDCVGSHFERTG